MSRKTIVCVLLVSFLVVAGSVSPTHAASWSAGDFSPSVEDDGLGASPMAVSSDVDPDGLTAASPTAAGGGFLDFLRLLLQSLLM